MCPHQQDEIEEISKSECRLLSSIADIHQSDGLSSCRDCLARRSGADMIRLDKVSQNCFGKHSIDLQYDPSVSNTL